ncbi:MAG: hypothetical protein PHX30_01200 [Candidatus Pacebacteria bacterium]|nr:hypothetical protein [Candidatus Paceibacterota bacterium]
MTKDKSKEEIKKIKKIASDVIGFCQKEIGAAKKEGKGYTFPIWIGAEENTSVFKEGAEEALKSFKVKSFKIVCEEIRREEKRDVIGQEAEKDDTKYYIVSLRRK